MTEVLENLMKDISDRLTAMGEDVKEDRIRGMVTDQFNLLTSDKEFVRKMRFGGQDSAPELIGTKYARWGLSIADIEWLYDLQESLRGQRKVAGGQYEGPSES